MHLTIAICTYRRHEPLRQTLTSLAACIVPQDVQWDVLVVDNAGDAQVRQLVEGFADRLPVRYEVEPTTGTSHARNHAVRVCEAAGTPVVLFTDDDVTFEERWLVTMANTIREHGDCDFWGGRVEPIWPSDAPPPAWFDQERCPMLGDTIVQYRRGEQPRAWDGERDPPFYTANLALRVKAVAAAGYFDTTVGHRGAVRMGMEDSLMVRAIAAAGGSGGRGWYAADAVVHHPVPIERLSRKYARQFAWRQGWLSVHSLRRASPRLPRWLYRVSLGDMVRGAAQWLGGTLTLRPAVAFAGQFQALFSLSKLWHALCKPKARS
ncbi:MAG: glycosyltransferase [Phycisphaeraceae bacterium]